MLFDVQAQRSKFPSIRDSKAIYFDNPAGTQVPEPVIKAVKEYYLYANANSGGMFDTSRRSDEFTHRARSLIADFLNAPRIDEVVFGANMTTLNFALSHTLARTLSAGDEIILTRMDHDANVAPWLHIAHDKNLTVRWIDLDVETGTLNLDTYASALSEKTKIVATVHASNALGTINPIREMAVMAHGAGALHIVDAVQSAPHVPLDVQDLGCDFLLCSAYKFFGPHVGVMWGKYDLLAELPVYKVRPAKDKPPYRWETGTPSFETIHATGQAVDYLRNIGRDYGIDHAAHFTGMAGNRLEIHAGMAAIRAYERELVTHLITVLSALPGLQVYGITDPERFDERVPTVVFTLDGYTAEEVAKYLADRDIYVWSGDYYAVEVMSRYGHEENGMVRVGLAHYNTHQEIDRLGVVLEELV